MNEEEIKNTVDKIEKKNDKKYGYSYRYIDKMNYLIDKYKTAMFFVLLQLIIILFLIIGYLGVKSDITVEVNLPKIVKDTDYGKLKVGMSESNKLYYEVWGRYLINDVLLNIGYQDAEKKTKIFLNMLYPDIAYKYKEKIQENLMNIVKNNLQIKFREISHKIVKSGDVVYYKSNGVLETKIGKLDKKESVCTATIGMFTKNYHLFVKSYGLSCKEDKK